jgi:fluoride exporter
MHAMLLVALGGAIGSVTRYLISGWILHQTLAWRFPLGTFIVNLLGCLMIGVISGLAVKEALLSMPARIFLITGVCGGFTTFSAFGLETFYLLKRDALFIAFSYVSLSIICGILALWLGFVSIEWVIKYLSSTQMY